MSVSIVGSGTVGSMTLGVYPRKFQLTATSYGALFGGSTPPLFAWLADLTPYVQDDWTITQQLGQPSLLTFTMIGDTPLQEGLGVRVSLSQVKGGGVGDREIANSDFGELLFQGNMTEVTTELAQIGQRPVYRVQAQDLTWLLNRYRNISGTFGSVGFNTLVRQILEAGPIDFDRFRVGFVPQSLGNAPKFVFRNTTVLEALQQVADAAGAYLSVTADRRVHLFQQAAHLTTADSITNTSRNAFNLRSYRDLTNIVTQVNLYGKTTQSVPIGFFDRIAVTNGAIFSPLVNFRILMDNEQLATVGSIAWQPSSIPAADALLFLSAGVVGANAYGNVVPVQHVAARTVAANSVVLQMSDGTSNVRIYNEDNTDLTNIELEARADLLITRLSEGYREITFSADDERHNLARQLSVGQRIAIDITSPVTIAQNQTLMVQDVRIEQVGTTANSTVDIRRTARLGLQLRTQTLDQTLAGTRTTR